MKEKKPINVEIGHRLKHCREAAGLTQEALSEMLGLGVKHISAIERGAVGVSVSTIQSVCRVLSISSDELLFGNVPKNDTSDLIRRMERLTPTQYEIASSVMGKLLEAFNLSNE